MAEFVIKPALQRNTNVNEMCGRSSKTKVANKTNSLNDTQTIMKHKYEYSYFYTMQIINMKAFPQTKT